MPEIMETKARVVHAAVGSKPEFVKILDWQGKFLTFILVDEIRPPKPRFLYSPKRRKEVRFQLHRF